ncbi:MAG TPA: methyltransferase domain-containing protein, partial [Acidimicrobiia bacterium]|nr:methyltransferase domain-containing protein [Acidimicrobiia bacterium]
VSSVGHRPDGTWTFDDGVTRVFDDMLARSIPQLDVMRELVFRVGSAFVRPGSAVVDLGCSRGGSLARFVDGCPDATFVGVDRSAPMLAACRDRFGEEVAQGRVRLEALDLDEAYPAAHPSLTLAVLTLQFVQPEVRPRVVRDAYEHARPGGAIVVVEKVRGGSAESDALLTALYEAMKRANGYSDADIERKRLSLDGVLVPLTPAENVELLEQSGWHDAECFWRSLNFAAWVAVKL